MKNSLSRSISLIMAAIMLMSILSVAVSAHTFSKSTTDVILDTIETQYSTSLRNAISDLLYDSDYSDFINYTETLRSYSTVGNQKSWPISNADSYRSWVTDRGEKVDWGSGSAGCMAYANFFAYSVYGTRGTSMADKDWITLDNTTESASELKTFLDTYAQPGEHLRISNKHSVIYLCSDATGFYIAEYWGGGVKNDGVWSFSISNDQYYLRHYTYAEFVKKYDKRDIFMYQAYEKSAFANETVTPETPSAAKTRDIVVVIDISTSMSGNKIANTKTAAKNFVNQILAASSTTRIAIVTYGTNSNIVKELSNDKNALCSAIDNITLKGVTNIYSGLETAGSLLAQSSADKKAIVIMTDGSANEGQTSADGNKTVAEGYDIYFNSYNAAIYELAQDYVNNKNYTIYSLGFGISENSSSYNLMKHIASFDANNNRYFWLVTNNNVGDIIFTFEDIADSIATKKSIVIAIECPVDVAISLGSEVLDKNNTKTSFGEMEVTTLTENDYQYKIKLEPSKDYEIQITGLAEGTMNFTIQYITGDTTDTRRFLNVPITANTVIITSSTDELADFILYVDENGDTEIDEGWNATTDETVTIPDTDILVQLYPNEEYEPTVDEPTVDEPSEEDDIKDKNSSFDANYMLKVFRSNYVITASAGKGGTISPEGRFMMNYFGEKTYTFTPDDGMEITDVLVNGKSIGVVDSYTFKNITSNCTIKVLFEKAD